MVLNIDVPDVVLNPPNIEDLTNILHLMTHFIYYTGEYMYMIIPFLALFVLRNNLLLYYFYFLGFCMTAVSNFALKNMIQIRRPCINPHLFDLALEKGKHFVKRNGKRYHIYGMPSGHSQECGFTLVFLSLFLRDGWVSGFFFLITILTMYQRVLYEHHSIIQTLIGVTLGAICGIGMHYYAVKYIEGNLSEKQDDHCLYN